MDSYHSDVTLSVDILLASIDDSITAMNRAGAQAMETGDYDTVIDCAERARTVSMFRNKVAALKDEWAQLWTEGASQ